MPDTEREKDRERERGGERRGKHHHQHHLDPIIVVFLRETAVRL